MTRTGFTAQPQATNYTDVLLAGNVLLSIHCPLRRTSVQFVAHGGGYETGFKQIADRAKIRSASNGSAWGWGLP